MSDEYSPEQKGRIARHFVNVAPHGEIHDLIKDLRKVCDKNITTDNWVSEVMTDYNKRRFVVCQSDTTKVICCPQGEVGTNKFLHPDKKLICEVDPVKQKIVSETDGSSVAVSGDIEAYRAAISKQLKEYLTSFYEDGSSNPNATSRGVGFAYGSAQGQIAIVIAFTNLNLGNYWTGGWQSECTFNVSEKKTISLEGRIRLNVHYYEDGNVQLNSVLSEKGEVDVSDVDTTAKAVINTIQTLETDFQQRLEKFYVQMHDSTFKNMRRFLPKVGKKLDWRVSVHSLAAEAASQ